MSLDYLWYESFWTTDKRLPEEKGQGLEKGLKVVVVTYGGILIQLNVSEHLRQQESRWFVSKANVRILQLLKQNQKKVAEFFWYCQSNLIKPDPLMK